MPAGDQAKGGRVAPAGEQGKVGRVSLHARAPSWVLGRLVCSIGALVLLQNFMLLHWGSTILRQREACKVIELHPYAVADDVARFPSTSRFSSSTMIASTPVVEAWPLPKAQGRVLPLTPVPTVAPVSTGKGTHHGPGGRRREAPPQNVAGSASVQQPAPSLGSVSQTVLLNLGRKGVFMGAGGYDSVKDGLKEGQLQRESSLSMVSSQELRLFGQPPPKTVKLCLGLSAVSRQREYLFDTISSILGTRGENLIKPAERLQVVVVLHLADFNSNWVSRTGSKLRKDYAHLIADGRFHAIHAPMKHYPELNLCPPFCSYGEDGTRVKWRAKQNIDYAFLMQYSAPLAPYYLQLEDDLSFTPNWIQKIVDYLSGAYPPGYVSKENTPWRLIEFAEQGFVGKLMQSNELPRVAQLLLLFYDQMSADKLLKTFHRAMTQGKKITYWKQHSALFQHVGAVRSSGGFELVQDGQIMNMDQPFNNPQGTVYTSMTIVPTYDARFLYFPGGEPENRDDSCDFSLSSAHKDMHGAKRCWLWGKGVESGNHITLVFNTDVAVKAVLVELGHNAHPKDILTSAVFEVAERSSIGGTPDVVAQGEPAILAHCGTFLHVMNIEKESLVYWEQGMSSPKELPKQKVRCLRVLVKRSQPEWAIVQRIQVRS